MENTVDPDEIPHYVASDLGLHCLPMTLWRVFRLEWVKILFHAKELDIWAQLFKASLA